jgi:trans-aconitate methyltransferase
MTQITRADVRGAYQFFLNRMPENENVIDSHVNASKDLRQLRERFLGSWEFYRNNSRELLRHFAVTQARQVHKPIQYECSDGELAEIFGHIASVWSSLGEIEPHFSVLSTPNYKPENLPTNLEQFYRSGRPEVALLIDELKGLGLPTADFQHVIELGCGVGRVTRYLADMGRKVTGYDISRPHLDLARTYLNEEGCEHVDLVHVQDPASVSFPCHDLFYSRIVLQHNPPPVQFFLINRFLSALAPGGVAVFQIPVFMEGYGFSAADYIANMDDLDNQELHALPQRAVFDAIYANDCRVLSVYRDNSLSQMSQTSNRFVVQRN